MTFGRDGMLYVAVSGANAPASRGLWSRVIGGVAQDPARHGGKVPATAPSGMLFYTGDRYPNFKGNLFVGQLKGRRVERIVMNDKGYITGREDLFVELGERIRDVRQGRDGWIYLLTDSTHAEVLRIELN